MIKPPRASPDDEIGMTPFRGNTRLLELQVAIIAIAVGVVAVSSVMATERRMLKRLHAGLKPTAAATRVITPDNQSFADARE